MLMSHMDFTFINYVNEPCVYCLFPVQKAVYKENTYIYIVLYMKKSIVYICRGNISKQLHLLWYTKRMEIKG